MRGVNRAYEHGSFIFSVVHLIINSVFECIKGESTLSTNWYYNTKKNMWWHSRKKKEKSCLDGRIMIWIWVLYELSVSRMWLTKQFYSVLKTREVGDNGMH